MAVTPVVLALILCDLAWRDPATGKFFIMGTFSSINAESYPAKHGAMMVYCVLTDGQGKIPIRLSVVALDADTPDEQELASAGLDVEFADQRSVAEVAFALGGLVIPREGEYRIRIEAAGQYIMERRFTAKINEARE